MQCSRRFFFQMCLSLLVSTGSCRCKPLNDVLQSEDRGGFSETSEQDLVEEEDRLHSFLGTMKEEFLRKLNLSDVPHEQSKVYPPPFMIELYNKYASDTSSMPRSDVIRSFTVQDVSHSEKNGTKSKHRLLFNVTVPNHEEVTMAELRLFTLLDNRTTSTSTNGIVASIKVYEVEYKGNKAIAHLVDGKEVIGTHHSWETFDVTTAIQSWVKSDRGASEFEVVVDRWDCRPFKGGGLDVSVGVGVRDNTAAALIVFSDDLGSRKREAKKELREMIVHEEETLFSRSDWQGSDYNEIPLDLHPRRKRQADTNYCRRTSMRVNFKDIGWDQWIVAPPEYDAFECRGVCYYPLTDDMTPSKHALIQTLVNLKNPKKANMACCVPTKLDPITVMYQENGVITIRHPYEEMKVAECGCR
ncbi:growth/differentiation factor 2 [Salmo salar]|uniref:Growth/differentiation factor 2 n=1 Tax=Salmo salar TaxID=8030 RepID=A0A1S3Q391_SALSA|nr:growth/differentiation factor 2-like [Salmo salar]|eukprot:XP_014034417.1 PREDICTED: growth/differentiation factor 2-like [Salmo salar]